MSDEQTIEAIRQRNDERKPETLAEFAHRADIDFLLSEIEARDAEIRNLNAIIGDYIVSTQTQAAEIERLRDALERERAMVAKYIATTRRGL